MLTLSPPRHPLSQLVLPSKVDTRILPWQE